MPPHIIQHRDRGFTYYLADGDLKKSLKTKKKGLAQHLLEQYIKGKYGLQPLPTVQEYFAKWIEKKIEPLFRRVLIRDYKQHFRTHILPKFKTRHMFITEAINRGENPLAVAQYCGTSLAMIEVDYCGVLGLRLDQTVFEPQAYNP